LVTEKKDEYLITGASKGIGFEIAKSLSDSGHIWTIATARSGDALSL
jgi:NAD(P)-dependent dehydrogenase (short-subunit alcohol dehydrogenase family)